MLDWEFLKLAIEPELIPGLLAAAIFTLGILIIHFLPRFKWLAAAALLIAITPVALPGFWFSSGDLGVSDWDLYFSYYHALRRTVTEFHQFPLWNPWLCGGSAALGDPEFPIFSPIFASILAFGVLTGFKVNIYLVTAIGALGMLALGKRLGLSVYAATLAALGMAFSSVNLLEIVEGHPNIFSAMWIPWIFWSWLAAYRSHPIGASMFRDASRGRDSSLIELKKPISNALRNIAGAGWLGVNIWPIITGVFLALTFFQGGIYLLSYTALAFLVLIFLSPRHVHAFRISLMAGLWALALAAIKFVPTALWLSQFQDESYASSTYTIPYLHKIFFGRFLHGAGDPGFIIPNQGSGWHEYGAYIGAFVVSLAVIGYFGRRRRKVVQALALAAVLAIFLSSSGPVLKPVFDQLSFIPRSNVSRIILFAVIPLALLAGYGLDVLLNKSRHRWTAILFTVAALAFVSADLFTLTAQLSSQAFVLPYPELQPAPAPPPIAHMTHKYDIRHRGTDYSRAYAAARRGYGTNSACNVLRPKQYVRTVHDQENFGPVLQTTQTTVLHTDWSPNRVITTAAASADQAELMLNTNYAKGWWVKVDPDGPWQEAHDIQRRVGVYLTPGTHTVIFEFRPRGLWAGITITTLATIAALSWIFYKRRHAQPAAPHL